MSKLWPKVIRDPVHNIIAFEGTDCDRLLLDLINTKEFQRLRRIKQLGMSELVFPGANHSRFAHCIGVMHVARRILERVERVMGGNRDDDQHTAVLAASLLHDVGHGPFSHAFEKITGQKHEERTLEIIRSDDTEVGKRLRAFHPNLPDRLAIFFDEDIDAEKKDAAEIPEYLTQVVSSQLDADRFDYLLRDSYATGTDYGRFDLNWIIIQLMMDPRRNRLIVGRKGVDAAEAYVFARSHMYKSVYFHKTVRSAEVMVRLAFKRFKQLVDGADSQASDRVTLQNVPHAVNAAFSPAVALDDYLALDDYTITEFLKACADSVDPILQSLGSGIIHRRLYKAIDVSDSDAPQVVSFCDRSREIVAEASFDVEYAFIHDTAADTPYKPYDPDSSKPASQIYVEVADGSSIEISARAKALERLRETYKLTRYYFPEAVREAIDKAGKETLSQEKV